ncbi:MAG: ECF transporter S component [Syntrophales bacterium]|nr:ECF transporter S component [Syntrophales bacterium]
MKINAKRMLLIGCGWGIVYGILNGILNIFLLPSAPFISLRPQIALPMAIGILFHPLAGFAAGFTGNFIGDGISGYGLWKFWNWHLANGLMGFIPGLIRYLGIGRIGTVREFGILEMIIVLASGIAVAFAVLLDFLFLHFMKFPSSFPSWILPAFLTDAVNGFILVPVVLIMARRISMTLEIRTILLVTVLLLLAILSTAGAITWAIMDDLVSHEALIENFYMAGIVSVVLIVIGFLASVAFVRRFTDPVMHLTRAAEEVEKGSYDVETLSLVSARRDELGQLSRVFQDMIRKVREREQHLRQQVEELQIRIDRDRQAKEVREIVETDYFRELKKKAKEFRES